jgi:hypothetical protein
MKKALILLDLPLITLVQSEKKIQTNFASKPVFSSKKILVGTGLSILTDFGYFSRGSKSILTKHGLTVIPTGDFKQIKKLDELHVLMPELLPKSKESAFANTTLAKCSALDKEYYYRSVFKKN